MDGPIERTKSVQPVERSSICCLVFSVLETEIQHQQINTHYSLSFVRQRDQIGNFLKILAQK